MHVGMSVPARGRVVVYCCAVAVPRSLPDSLKVQMSDECGPVRVYGVPRGGVGPRALSSADHSLSHREGRAPVGRSAILLT